MFTKFDAIVALVENPSFTLEANNSITWLSANKTQPSEEQIQAKLAELKTEYDANKYQRDRTAAYPSWQDQLDNIFHNGVDAWKADIQAIKDQFPKP